MSLVQLMDVEILVCLIPKKENTNMVKEFKPINLSVYKIMNKVLANPLRELLPTTTYEAFKNSRTDICTTYRTVPIQVRL